MSSEIQGMFDRIAHRYDFLNHLLSLNKDRGWRRLAVRTLDRQDLILDLCTGTGDFGRTLIKEDRAGKVVALDFSSEMIRRGTLRGGPKNLFWLQGDALNLSFGNNTFGAVVCGFGIRNLGRQGTSRGLEEVCRILRPSGRLVILEFYPRPGFAINLLQEIYVKRALPMIGGLVSGDPEAYRYLAKTMNEYFTRPEFEKIMSEAGFRLIEWRDLSMGVVSMVIAEKI